tara:strand:- start:15423 stop:18416 length:2994 start_codon:yes stop_codon:yes gene_type:complete
MADNPSKLESEDRPVSYIDWLQTLADTARFSETQLFKQYNDYVADWYTEKKAEKINQGQYIDNVYIELLKQIAIDYSTADEKRFLLNIDYTDKRELDIVIPYFVKKLKQVTQYFIRKRTDVKHAKIKHSFKGSEAGARNTIKDIIIDQLRSVEFTKDYPNTYIPPTSAIDRDMVVEVDSLYDEYPNYFDNSPDVDASEYNTSQDTRHTLFNSNVENVDPNLYLNFTEAIQKLFEEIPILLTSSAGDDITSSGGLNLTFNTVRTDIENLPEKNFVGTGKTKDDLALNYQKQLIEKFSGTKYCYLSTGNTQTETLSGTLFEPSHPIANILNRYYPTHASVPSTSHLKSIKEIGGFFTPDKLGIINYSSVVLTYTYDQSKLEPNTLYIFPDPDEYGPGRGNTQADQLSPVKHADDVTSIRANKASSQQGDIVNDKSLQKFYPYQSREETLQYQPGGVSKSTDNIDLWSGDVESIWGNEDVYPILPLKDIPVSDKIQDLLVTDEVAYEWKTDIFGNEYALYKKITPARKTTDQVNSNFNKARVSDWSNESNNPFSVSGLSADYTNAFTTPEYRYFNHQLSAFTTQYDSRADTLTVDKPIYDRQDNVYGRLFFRNGQSTIIDSVSSALSAVFVKYSNTTDIIDELHYKIKNFDLIQNVIVIETQNFLVLEKFNYDHSSGVFTTDLGQQIYLSLSGDNANIVKFADPWYNEPSNDIILSKTALHPYLSGSNYKIIYPEMYRFNIGTNHFEPVLTLDTLLPTVSSDAVDDMATTYQFLSSKGFTLSGSGEEINITEIDRPSVWHNSNDQTLSFTFFGTDNCNYQYLHNYYFDTADKSSYTVKQVGLIKPDINVFNYNLSDYASTSGDTVPGTVMYDEGIPGVGGSTNPVSGRTCHTYSIDPDRDSLLLGSNRETYQVGNEHTWTSVASTDIGPYTHNVSYLLYNLALSAGAGARDIAVCFDVAFYTNTAANTAYAMVIDDIGGLLQEDGNPVFKEDDTIIFGDA